MTTTVRWEGDVPTTEERLAFVEGRMSEFSSVVEALRQAIAGFGQRLGTFEARVDQRFALIDQRFAAIDQRFADMDAKMTSQFHWLLGVQITMFVAMIGTILTAFFAR